MTKKPTRVERAQALVDLLNFTVDGGSYKNDNGTIVLFEAGRGVPVDVDTAKRLLGLQIQVKQAEAAEYALELEKANCFLEKVELMTRKCFPEAAQAEVKQDGK